MSPQPNVVLMVADDHRGQAIGASGDSTVRTPVLDALAGRGVSFLRAHMMGGLSGAVCVPARASLLTGMNPFRASTSQRVDDYAGVMTLAPGQPTLPEVMRRAGYHTHVIGKWHNDTGSLARGFDGGDKLFLGGMCAHERVPVQDFDPEGRYPKERQFIGEKFSTELFCDAAVDFIREYRREPPFFIYLALTSPHDPRTAPEPYAGMYDPSRIPLPANFMAEHPFDNGEMKIRDEKLAPWPRTPEVIRRHLADYYAMISHMDAQMGRVLAALRESGHDGNTIIVYTGDHGLAVGQHGLMGKQNLYEHSIRVPLILRGPGLPAGRRSDALVQSYDLFPTICELVGTAAPPNVEGRSLLPLIEGKVERVRETVFSLYKDCQRMVSDGRWKLIRYQRSAATGAGVERLQLFDLQADPWETRDLSSDPAQREVIRRLTDELSAWQRQTGDPFRV